MPAKPAPIADPYLTLGLQPGATMAEVKRAYRQLAKTFHPDSAGEKATPRFLAIQAAYEQIRTGRVVLGGSRAGRPAPAAPAAAPSEPWRADPARARAARERARAGGTGSATAGAAPSGAGGATGQGTGGRASTGTSGTRTGTRRRATRKATMGSTSYDEARDPADATWSGASWYGPSTGEYWIVNPREYADPRKHGPDYQQRARRLAQEGAGQPEPTPDPDPEPVAAASDEPRAAAGQRQAPRTRPAPRSTRWQAAATETSWGAAGEAPGPAAEPDRAASARPRWLGDQADDPVRRLGLALVAWPPIGLVTAALIGDATGCATFGAQCDGAEPMLPWLAQAMILGLLLLLPALARILAVGTAAVLVALAPITAFLLAVGDGIAPQAGGALTVLLVTVWAVGVALAVAARSRRTPARAAGRRGARP